MESDEWEHQVLGARLKTARLTLGLTQADTSTALNIPRSAVADMEAGKRKVSGLELRRLSRLYRRNLGWLLGEEPDPSICASVADATRHLNEGDRVAVLNFARFLAAQSHGDPF